MKLETKKVLILSMALAAVLRLHRLGAQSLWIDEVLSVNVARDILHKGFFTELFNPHGPVFFYALAAFVPWGASEWLLRLPSVLFGVALVAVMYLLGRELGGRKLGLVAAFLTALSPFAVWYSQEARYVSVFVLLAALSTLFTWRYGSRQGRWDLAGYVVTTVLMLFAFVGGIFLVAGQDLFLLLIRPRWPVLRRWLVGQALLAALFVPWLVHAYQIDVSPWEDSRERSFSVGKFQTGLERAVRPIDMGYALFTFGAGFSMGPSTRALHEDLSLQPVWKTKYEVALAVAALGLALAAGLAGAGSPFGKSGILLLACLAPPVLGPYVLSTISQVAYNVRYASAAFPAYLLLLSAGVVWWMKRPWFGLPVLTAVTGVMLVALVMNYSDPEYFRDDNRGAARVLEQMRKPGEPLVVGVEERALRYYYGGNFKTWDKLEILPAGSPTGDGSALEASRLWVASTRWWEDAAFPKFVARLRSCFPVEQDVELPGFEVIAFRLKDTKNPASCSLRWKP